MHIVNAVDAFGRQMGINGLSLDEKGCLTLNIGEDGSLFLERKEDTLVVSFAKKAGPRVSEALKRGFELCHFKNEPRYNLRVGLFREDIIVCISKLEKHHVNAGMLNEAVPYLFEVMEKIL